MKSYKQYLSLMLNADSDSQGLEYEPANTPHLSMW